MTESLPRKLSDDTLARITGALELAEVKGPDGGPLMTLASQMGPDPVGTVRVFGGKAVQQLVTVSLAVPAIGLDSHMLFAFTRPDSAVPHFTLDSVFAGGSYAFHIDLIPRADLGANLAYMDEVYGPLTEHFSAAGKVEGLSPAALGPRQLAIMSPWMLAYRADEAAFRAIAAHLDRYLVHWLGLVERGISSETLAELDVAGLPARDASNRAALFNPDVDPVWNQVGRLIGDETGARIREILKSQAVSA